MIDGKTDFDYRQDYDPAYSTQGSPCYQSKLMGQKATSLQLDTEVALHMTFVKGFEGFLGFRSKTFQNVLGNNALGVYGYENVATFAPATVGFSGVTVGLGYRF